MVIIHTGQGYKYRANSHDYLEITYLNIMLKQNIVGLETENIRFHYDYLDNLLSIYSNLPHLKGKF